VVSVIVVVVVVVDYLIRMNSLIDLGAITILILLTAVFQLVLSLPKGSWTSLIFPSIVLYLITRVVFHYVYFIKNTINKYTSNTTSTITKIVPFMSKIVPFIMLYIFCQIVLSINPSVSGTYYHYYYYHYCYYYYQHYYYYHYQHYYYYHYQHYYYYY